MQRAFLLISLFVSTHVFGFCGFYVAKADASLYNKASQVILVRHDNKTAITMFSDYKGEMKDFALVVPVPEVLSKEQINVADRAIIERVDAFSAPRLVEYFDSDPCQPVYTLGARAMIQADGAAPMMAKGGIDKSLGVSIEAKYTIGEYDILILSAKESNGLETWLTQNGYKLPKGAGKALEPYVKQKMKFFVAKVNLAEQTKTGFTYLRPIQFAFESPKFMLPIRLGMVNADGPQDMLIYAITKKGRVETTNYRTVKLPTGMDLPVYVKNKFASFYTSMFETAHNKENKKVAFLEYAWNMSWCDPCAADPLTNAELKKIGVFWLDEESNPASKSSQLIGPPGFVPPMQGVETFISRIHVKYDAENFPEDLFFQETADTENFQGRYVLRHPWTKEMKCEAAKGYQDSLKTRRDEEAQTLAKLTNWDIKNIYKEMGEAPPAETKPNKKWFKNIFK